MRSTDGLRRYWAGYKAAANALYDYGPEHAWIIWEYGGGHSQAYWNGYLARLRKAGKPTNREETNNADD